jgi:hypothetical protein
MWQPWRPVWGLECVGLLVELPVHTGFASPAERLRRQASPFIASNPHSVLLTLQLALHLTRHKFAFRTANSLIWDADEEEAPHQLPKVVTSSSRHVLVGHLQSQ